MSDTEIFDWRNELEYWINKHFNVSSTVAESIPILFENAFGNTRCPERAWFGLHSSGVSLVVGNIYLAAIHRSGKDKGLWLLVDRNPQKIDNIEYQQVKSTQKSKYPLVWMHSVSLNVIPELIGNAMLWNSFASVSEKILFAPVANNRDQVQLKRNKKRLDSFWDNPSIEMVDKQFREAVISALRDSSEVRKRRLEKAQVDPKRIKTVSYVFERNPDVVAEVLLEANGICQACKNPAPFIRKRDHTPYLEVHHKKPLAEGGKDTVKNAIALCPNCHRKAHYS